MTIEALIRAYFDAFNRHDLDATLALMTEDVVHEINQGGAEVGKDAFRKFKQTMDVHYLEQITDLEVMVSQNRGCAEFTCSGEYLKKDGNFPEAHGQKYSIRAAAIFEAKDGKICRVTSYYNVPEWVRQVTQPA